MVLNQSSDGVNALDQYVFLLETIYRIQLEKGNPTANFLEVNMKNLSVYL